MQPPPSDTPRPQPPRDAAAGEEHRPVSTQSVDFGTILAPERILLTHASDKDSVLHELVDALAQAQEVADPEVLRREVFAREAIMSTGLGKGLAVPHVRLDSVRELVMAVAVNQVPLEDYFSLDDAPVRIICMLAAHHDQHTTYLKALAALRPLMKDEARRQAVLRSDSPDAIYAIFRGLT